MKEDNDSEEEKFVPQAKPKAPVVAAKKKLLDSDDDEDDGPIAKKPAAVKE